MSIESEFRANLWAWLLLALFSAIPALGLWFWVGRKRNLFPPPRTRLVPWSGFEVCLTFLFTLLLLPAFLNELLIKVGFFNWLGFEAADGDLADARRRLWLAVIAFPFQFLGTLVLLRALSGTRLFQLGLTTWRVLWNGVNGWLAWCLLTPPVLVLHILVGWAYWISEGVPPEEHLLTRLARAQPLRVEWVLIIFSGVFVAPVLEELLFRGVLQGWAAARPWGAPITLAVAFALAFGRSFEKIMKGWDGGTFGGVLRDLEPALFVSIMVLVCFLGEPLFRRWLPRPYAARAIFSTALLFAVFHDWPTPIPLFVLGLGLGYLAYRTRSLVAPILVHALFNGVACLLMLQTFARR